MLASPHRRGAVEREGVHLAEIVLADDPAGQLVAAGGSGTKADLAEAVDGQALGTQQMLFRLVGLQANDVSWDHVNW